MLEDADRDLIRRDGSLPGLGTLLDDAQFLDRLRRANPGRAVAWARLSYLRYKPGTNCLAAYEVGIEGGRARVHGKAWTRGVASTRVERRGGMGAEGEALMGWADESEGVVAGAFPWDEKLPSLRRWVDVEFRSRFFSERRGMDRLAGAVGLRVLNHKPERRLVAALLCEGGVPLGVLKVHARAGFRPAYHPARKLRSGFRYAVPVLLGKSERHAAVVLGWQPGEGLDGVLADGGEGLTACASVGAALAEFHSNPVRLDIWHRTDWVREVDGHGRMLGWLLPSVGERAARLGARLAEGVSGAPEMAAAVHGDFYSKQILLREGAVVFLDMDGARRGSAWFDLATFLAHLEIDVIRGRYPAARRERLTEAFLAGYGEVSGRRQMPGLSGCVAAVLLTQAAHCFRSRQSDWARQVVRILDRVEELAGAAAARVVAGWEGGGASGVDPADGTAREDDPALPGLSRALDGDWMSRRLREEPRLKAALDGVSLTGISVVRHKAGRRCLIRYRFARTEGGPGFVWIGKLRARRGRGWDLGMRAARGLRAAGLREDGDVAVPEPVGEISELLLELQRGVGGEPCAGLMTGWNGAELAARCAFAVARLHGSRVTVAREHGVEQEMAILRDRLGRLIRERPDDAERVARILSGCEVLAGAMDRADRVLVHRDYHPDQVLVDGRRIWLLDLDLCAMGDPCLDHGNFLAHLEEWELQHGCRLSGPGGCVEAYRVAALKCVGAGAARRLSGYWTLSLARHLFLSTRYGDRGHTLPALLELCEQRLGLRVIERCEEISK
ncbi:MAG: phosphotransferase [Limisphaerales bacterium]